MRNSPQQHRWRHQPPLFVCHTGERVTDEAPFSCGGSSAGGQSHFRRVREPREYHGYSLGFRQAGLY